MPEAGEQTKRHDRSKKHWSFDAYTPYYEKMNHQEKAECAPWLFSNSLQLKMKQIVRSQKILTPNKSPTSLRLKQLNDTGLHKKECARTKNKTRFDEFRAHLPYSKVSKINNNHFKRQSIEWKD